MNKNTFYIIFYLLLSSFFCNSYSYERGSMSKSLFFSIYKLDNAKYCFYVDFNLSPPIVAQQIFCGAVVISDIEVKGEESATFKWYDTPVEGNAFEDNYELTSSGVYYVSQVFNEEESERVLVDITIKEKPSVPKAEPQSFCGMVKVEEIVVTGEEETKFNWYESEDSEVILAEISESGVYYVSQIIDDCESDRLAVDIIIKEKPSVPKAEPQSFCGMVKVGEIVVTGGEETKFNWYESEDSEVVLAEINKSGIYYVSQIIDDCESDRLAVDITIKEKPSAPKAETQTFCSDVKVSDLKAEGEKDNTVIWYADSEKTKSLSSSELIKSGVYYVAQKNADGCESEVKSVQINIAPKNIVDVPVNEEEKCDLFAEGTLVGASTSGFEKPSCYYLENLGKDVWFQFTAKSYEELVLTVFDIEDKKSKESGSIYVVVYKGSCSDGYEEILCFDTNNNKEISAKLKGLIKEEDYLIRIVQNGSKENEQDFKICLTTELSDDYLKTYESGTIYSTEELVNKVLVKADCDLVSNITSKTGTDFGEANGIGYFTYEGSDFAFKDGVILATNGVKYAPGPAEGGEGGDSMNWTGDADLEKLLVENGVNTKTYNASVLEFDFIPIKDTLKFDFIFTSNEYGPSYQCQYSDVFAFFLTEIGTGKVKNLAVIPNTKIPISVTTVHDAKHQGDLTCGDANKEYFDRYYSDDPLGDGLPAVDGPINYKGMTVPMSAISVVKPGTKYHIKLAIADNQDSGVNSAVFLKGGSFDLGKLDLGEDLLIEENTALCKNTIYTLKSELDPNWVDITWYKDGKVISKETSPTLEVSETGDYKVVGKYKSVDFCEVEDEVRIEVFPFVEDVVNQPENLDYCEKSLIDKIDLSRVEKEMFENAQWGRNEYKVKYFGSKKDRDEDVNEIENFTAYPKPNGEAVKIFMSVTSLAGCEGKFDFILNPITATTPRQIPDQYVCDQYVFESLPKGQYYYTETLAQGKQYKTGDIVDIPGEYVFYIYSGAADCYEEKSFNVTINKTVLSPQLEDVTYYCENHILEELPSESKYYTKTGGPNGGGEELLAGNMVYLGQTIYVYTQSGVGPNYCSDETTFNIHYEDCPIPKGISPNDDGINDRLDLSVHGVTSLKIYNRYGVEVYSYGYGYTDQWTGIDKKGNKLPDGTYFYSITSHYKVRTGWIQISK